MSGNMRNPKRYISAGFSIFQSRLISATLIYLLLNIGMDLWRPLRDVVVVGRCFLDQDSLENKACAYDKLERTPEIVILGSSQAMVAIAAADFFSRRQPFPQFFSARLTAYTDAVFLKEGAGLPLRYFNFACPGFMISHDLLLLSDLLRKGAPRLVVLMIGPRDFLDNLMAHPFSLREPTGNNFESALSRCLRIYAVRGDLMFLFQKFAVGLLDHWRSPLQGTLNTQTIDQPLDPGRLGYLIENYVRRYLPINWSMYLKQVDCLDRILDACQRNNVPVLIVNMPLPEFSRELLPEDLRDQYQAMLAVRSRKRGVNVLNLSGGSYNAEDFKDAEHMRHPGALKCCRAVASEIKRILNLPGN